MLAYNFLLTSNFKKQRDLKTYCANFVREMNNTA